MNILTNHLINETSPYLLQHAENPVDWYPWGKEAFDRAKAEDKPIFLSIGYSTCHWCHVMAHESFEDSEIADILNRYFISIKVDREERPDLDSIYMSVCQTLTGSGGWPTSIFITADQKPFLAGTYFPKNSNHGQFGLKELLLAIHEKWQNDRVTLLSSADKITAALTDTTKAETTVDDQLLNDAIQIYEQSFDKKYGGFGSAPKFPAPHNLLFIMQQYQKYGNHELMNMVETTLTQMYVGGMFDHIGYGFCRYSTDRIFLVPHFEKMLYDNALLISAYCKAYQITKKSFYRDVAEKTAQYVLTEMTSKDGGFFSAQDADSDGVEGKYYLFEPNEIIELLGKHDGVLFNEFYDITKEGNFEGKSIPNLMHTDFSTGRFDEFLPTIREYRRKRCHLNIDDKILTSWNSLMITALCALYRISRNTEYLAVAIKANNFIEKELYNQHTLYVSYRNGNCSGKGFLDDYANYIYALLSLYDATLDNAYLERAKDFARKAKDNFFDFETGGFYLYGKDNEVLILRPKECYDGAIPSGNSMMANCLIKLNSLMPDADMEDVLQKQLGYLCGEARNYPSGYAMFLLALSDAIDPPTIVTVVVKDKADLAQLPFKLPLDVHVRVFYEQNTQYKMINDKTTYYVCGNHSCHPPVNELDLTK